MRNEPSVHDEGLEVELPAPRRLLRTMCVIRAFEDRAIQLYNDGDIRGAIHSSAGQEAVAVGVCSALRRDDYVASTHRGHGHALAKGADCGRMLAELMGRATGYCGGKGGSMHVADLSVGMLGANGIVGASIELAVGAAFASRQLGLDRIAVAFFGEGGAAEGALHESLNLAALWRLPVVFFCENNQYAVTLPMARSVAAKRISDFGAPYGIPSTCVDGMDLKAVVAAAQEGVARARAGDGPTLIEAITYRFGGHSRSDPNYGTYRQKDEWQEWKERDPIPAYARAAGMFDELDAVRAEVEEEIERAVRFARESPFPQLEDAFANLYPSESTRLWSARDGSAGEEAGA